MHARRQRGAALLVVMLVVLVAATAVLVSRLDPTDLARDRDQRTAAALAAARAALIDYATTRQVGVADGRALLPCPDADGSGPVGDAQPAACGGAGEAALGRLPWRTLGIAPPVDRSGACLWYVVSGSHKEAGAAAPALVNPDSNGQFELIGVDSGTTLVGTTPPDRAVALVIAPMAALAGQRRSTGDPCGPDYTAAEYLDVDTFSGIANHAVSGVADAIERFAMSAAPDPTHNDRVVTVTRADIERAIRRRHDLDGQLRDLGLGLAACIAHYGSSNPGGAGDRRLPWPAPLSMADYRPDAAYDDHGAAISGRLPDVVDASNALTGNPRARVVSDCDPAIVAAWSPGLAALWRNWKDHFFYAVAEPHAPAATVPTACGNCLTVNGGGAYVAVIAFGGRPIGPQSRAAPPADTDARGDPANYLDGGNAAHFPLASGTADFVSMPQSSTFNDRLFCIDAAMSVSEC